MRALAMMIKKCRDQEVDLQQETTKKRKKKKNQPES